MGKILKNLSILQKFLFINLVVFIFIIIITFFYLGAIQKNLINEKQSNHTDIITQTIDILALLINVSGKRNGKILMVVKQKNSGILCRLAQHE